jgi:AraC-like DNA-binding protein
LIHVRPAGAARRRIIFEEAVAAIELGHDQAGLTAADIARKIFTSKRQLQRAFAEADTSFQATLHAVRMERSAKLLIESSLTVSRIASLVGYRYPSQFTKAFRRYYQLAPTELRGIDSPASEDGATWHKCGCAPAAPPKSAELRRLPKRDEHQRTPMHQLEQVERRLEEPGRAA